MFYAVMKNESKLNIILKLDIREYLISNQQSKIELQKKKSWNISYENKKCFPGQQNI